MQNLLGHNAAWRGRGLKVKLPLWLWAGRPHKIRLGKRHSGQIVRFEGYKDFKMTAYFSQRLNKTSQRLERFQKDSKRLAEIASMLADSSRNCNALMSAADMNRKSDVPTMSAALSCQCDGPVNCVAIQILLAPSCTQKLHACEVSNPKPLNPTTLSLKPTSEEPRSIHDRGCSNLKIRVLRIRSCTEVAQLCGSVFTP